MRKNNNFVRQARIEQELTIEEVAFGCHLDSEKYRHIEEGKIIPEEHVLREIYQYLSIDQHTLHRQKELSEEKARMLIGYALTLLSLLLVLSFFLKYGVTDHFSFPNEMKNGFYFVFKTRMESYLSVKIAFTLFIMQFGYYIYRLVTKRLSSNIFNIMTVLFSVSGVLFMYIGLYEPEENALSFVLLIVLAIFITILSIGEMIVYPLQHDFLSDKIFVRKLISIGFAIVLAVTFLSPIEYIIDYYEDLLVSEYFIFISWILFVLVTPFLKKTFFENRMYTSLYLSIPSLLFWIFYIVYTLQTGDELESEILYYCLFLLLPVLGVNIDFIIESLKSSVSHIIHRKE